MMTDPCGQAPFQTMKVAEAGLEPARPNGHRILNPERLPIPPLGQNTVFCGRFKNGLFLEEK